MTPERLVEIEHRWGNSTWHVEEIAELIDAARESIKLEELATLREKLKVAKGALEWNPIETAPRNNKAPLLLARFSDSGELKQFDFDGMWDSETDGWENGNNISYYWSSAFGYVEEPTHWMQQPSWFAALAKLEEA